MDHCISYLSIYINEFDDKAWHSSKNQNSHILSNPGQEKGLQIGYDDDENDDDDCLHFPSAGLAVSCLDRRPGTSIPLSDISESHPG